jgi:ACT domain-containing protein
LTNGEVKKIEDQIALGKTTVADMDEAGISEKKYKKYKDAKGTTTKAKALATQNKIQAIMSKASSMPTYSDMAKEGISESAYTTYKVNNNMINMAQDKTQLFKTIDLLISAGKVSVSDIKQQAAGFKTNWMTAYRDHYNYKGRFSRANIDEITARAALHRAAAKKI